MTETGGPAVAALSLGKRFQTGWWRRRDVTALEDLTLTVVHGEVFGLLGPNGSGKTTTIKLLLGFLFPTSGRAEVLGRPAGDPAAKARLGFLPEETYLHPFLTAEETLDFHASLFGIPPARRREVTARLLDRVGIRPADRTRRIREFSKGMARRVAFAQALVNDPDLLILDEPTSGMDPLGTAEMKQLILDLKAQGKTLLISSHLLADMEAVCDRIAILHQGRLIETGRVRDLLTLTDETWIRSRGAPEETLRKAAALLPEARLEHPTETLEAHFLKVIRSQRRTP